MTPLAISRRTLFRGAAAAAGTAALTSCRSGAGSSAPDGPLETTTIRLNKSPSSCFAAQAAASEFLTRAALTDTKYLDVDPTEQSAQLAAGAFDMATYPAQLAAARIDAGDPIVVLGGIHSGCWQIFGGDAVTSMTDFRGRTIATPGPQTGEHVRFAAALAHVGVNMANDVRVVTVPLADSARALANGDVDGLLALPPLTTAIRTERIGHVVLDAMMDQPWTQQYCCVAAVNRSYMTANPIATKAAFRAFLKGADVVAVDPERGVQRMVTLGCSLAQDYDATLGAIRMRPTFNVWRRFEPAETLNFYSLRLKEAGLMIGTPEQVIARGTDFRYLQTLRLEMRTP